MWVQASYRSLSTQVSSFEVNVGISTFSTSGVVPARGLMFFLPSARTMGYVSSTKWSGGKIVALLCSSRLRLDSGTLPLSPQGASPYAGRPIRFSMLFGRPSNELVSAALSGLSIGKESATSIGMRGWGASSGGRLPLCASLRSPFGMASWQMPFSEPFGAMRCSTSGMSF